MLFRGDSALAMALLGYNCRHRLAKKCVWGSCWVAVGCRVGALHLQCLSNNDDRKWAKLSQCLRSSSQWCRGQVGGSSRVSVGHIYDAVWFVQPIFIWLRYNAPSFHIWTYLSIYSPYGSFKVINNKSFMWDKRVKLDIINPFKWNKWNGYWWTFYWRSH